MPMTPHASRPLFPSITQCLCRLVLALVIAQFAVLRMNAARAESSSPSESFEARFAATEATSKINRAEPGRPDAAVTPGTGAVTVPPPPRPSDRRSIYRALVEKETARAGLSPEIAEAVMAVESSYNPDAIGGVGEIGLMQILPSTARMLGFAGTSTELAQPEVNIHYGVAYLAQAWRLAGGDLCAAVMKYRAGHGETRFSYRSVDYCLAVRSKLVARGFRVTGTVPVATFGEAGSASGCKRKCLGFSRMGRVDLAALNTRLSAIVMQVRAAR